MTADIITTRFYGKHFEHLGISDIQLPIPDALFGVSTILHFGRFLPAPIIVLSSREADEFLQRLKDFMMVIVA